MIKVIGARATRAIRVLWLLEELGVEYEHVPAKPRSPEVVALTGSGKVPALEVDGQVITDSTAIMTYLADAHGGLTAKAGTIGRARQDAVLHILLDEMDSVLWAAARHSFVLPEDRRVPEVKPAMIADYAASLPRIEAALKGPFLMGEEMTVPDILLTHCLGWAERAKFPEAPKALQDYRARMEAREAFGRAMARE
jgi:glutathione S-transferase